MELVGKDSDLEQLGKGGSLKVVKYVEGGLMKFESDICIESLKWKEEGGTRVQLTPTEKVEKSPRLGIMSMRMKGGSGSTGPLQKWWTMSSLVR